MSILPKRRTLLYSFLSDDFNLRKLKAHIGKDHNAPFFYNPDKDIFHIGIEHAFIHENIARTLKVNWDKDVWLFGHIFPPTYKEEGLTFVISNEETYEKYIWWSFRKKEELINIYKSGLDFFKFKVVPKYKGKKVSFMVAGSGSFIMFEGKVECAK